MSITWEEQTKLMEDILKMFITAGVTRNEIEGIFELILAAVDDYPINSNTEIIHFDLTL